MIKDLVYAVRMLRKNPGFTAVAVCSLAIGIGANSAIYSFADAMMLRPLPVAQANRVVTVSSVGTGAFGEFSSISYPDYIDLRDRNRTFDGLIASSYSSFGFAPDQRTQPRMKFGMFVSGNFFRVLGVRPALGRDFRPEEDRVAGRDAVAVLSHDLWNIEFGARASAVGEKIRLNGREFTIIGVAPETFPGLSQLKPALYVPLAMSASLGSGNNLVKRDIRWVDLKGRLKQGVGISQARADVAAIAAALRSTYPKADENLKLRVDSELEVRLKRSPPDTTLITMLGVLAICVLLVACANVAGLLLSRSAVRAREIAVRLAMGATRVSLVRQLLIENFLLALGGATGGLVVAVGAVRFFNTLPIPTDVPVDLSVRLDERALFFTLAVAVFSTFLFGLTPALRSTRPDLMEALKERGGTAPRTSRLWGRNLIVVGQVALSLLLLIISGVLLDGFRGELTKGPGFRTDRLQLLSFDSALVHYTDSQTEVFYRELLEKTRQAPGIDSAALTSSIPMAMNGVSTIGVVPEGRHLKRGERPIDTFDGVVSPGYFKSMAIRLVQGRDFHESDGPNTPPVAIVNEEFARDYWPNQSAIGKRVRLNSASGKLAEVVGVAKMSKYLWVSESPTDYLYLPFAQNPRSNMVLIAQSKRPDAATLVPVLRQVVQSLDRNMPVFEVRTMKSLYTSRAVDTPNMIIQTVAAMGFMGLLLSVVGLYGVVSYSVSRRSREFGIRMAVGADRRKVLRMVLEQGFMLGSIGVAIGLIVGVFATHAITSSMMFSFSVGALPFVWVSLLLLSTTVLSALGPARRASLIDPMRALREE